MTMVKSRLQAGMSEVLIDDPDLHGKLIQRADALEQRSKANATISEIKDLLLQKFPQSEFDGKNIRVGEFVISAKVQGGVERKATTTQPSYRLHVKAPKLFSGIVTYNARPTPSPRTTAGTTPSAPSAT